MIPPGSTRAAGKERFLPRICVGPWVELPPSGQVHQTQKFFQRASPRVLLAMRTRPLPQKLKREIEMLHDRGEGEAFILGKFGFILLS
jgi:hypothetical protein